MKRLVFLFFVVLVLGLQAQTISVLHGGDTDFKVTTHFQNTEKLLRQEFPNVEIKWYKIDVGDGSSLTMDAMLAAGMAPNVYIDSMVRGSKYLLPEYALPLDQYLDVGSYYPDSLVKIGGKILGAMVTGSGQGMAINLDLMKEIGFTVKPDWTISDFLKMAELVKQKYGGKKWATGMFAANQSGDYLINNWFESFGVKWYEGNYDKATISKNGGAKVYEFYQTLVKNGYVPPNSAMLTDDDYVIQWAKGDLAATAFFPAWAAPYFDTVIKQGLVKGKFNYAFMPFPRADGVKKVGTYYNGSVAIVRKTGTSVDKVAARFVEYLNDIVTENLFAELGNPPDKIKGNKPSDPHTAQVSKIIETEGIADWGLSDRRFTERRALQYPILQQVLNLKVSPDEAIRKFDAALSAVK